MHLYAHQRSGSSRASRVGGSLGAAMVRSTLGVCPSAGDLCLGRQSCGSAGAAVDAAVQHRLAYVSRVWWGVKDVPPPA